MIMGLFTGNAGAAELESVRATGEADGRAAAAAYVGGFLSGVSDEFEKTVLGFKSIELASITDERTEEADEPAASKPAKPKRTRG
jgi:hypothetical protein